MSHAETFFRDVFLQILSQFVDRRTMYLISKHFAILLLLVSIGELGNANMLPWCARASDGKYPNQTQSYVNTLLQSTDPILILYRQETEGKPKCGSNIRSSSSVPNMIPPVPDLGVVSMAATSQIIVSSAAAILNSLESEPAISCSCAEGALGIQVGDKKFYNCTNSNDRSPSTSSQASCKSEEQLNYTRWLMNKVIQCMQDPERPINSDLLFLKLTNESGLQTGVCYTGGCGIGQLTNAAIKQMGDKDETGRPFEIQDQIKATPDCEPLRKLVNPTSRPDSNLNFNRGSSNLCQILHPGSGAAVNLIYAVGYFKYLKAPGREMRRLIDFIEEKKASCSGLDCGFWENEDILNYAALLGYNMGGGGAAEAAIKILKERDLRKGGILNFQYYRNRIGNYGDLNYVKQVLTSKPRMVNSYFAGLKNGASCEITERSISGLEETAAGQPAPAAPSLAPHRRAGSQRGRD